MKASLGYRENSWPAWAIVKQQKRAVDAGKDLLSKARLGIPPLALHKETYFLSRKAAFLP